MGFKSVKLPYSIKTTRQNPNDILFEPLLSKAKIYKVAVGYFSSQWIQDVAEGIASLAINDGKAYWLISPQLSKDDYQALLDGSSSNQEYRDKIFKQSFRELFESLKENTLPTLSWLIADGILNFKIAIPCNDLDGIMHAKMGVFEDDNGNKVAFSGSYNLTGAAKGNWERIDIFSSYSSEDSQARVSDIEQDIDDMWDGNDKNLKVFSPSDEYLKPYLEFIKKSPRPYKLKSKFQIPNHFLNENGELRRYQMDAVNNWFKGNGRGIFCMATGSGKTVTALSAISKIAEYLSSKNSNLFILIIVPYIHLAKQWSEEAAAFGFGPIHCFDGVSKWQEVMSQNLISSLIKKCGVTLAITTNATFTSKSFRQIDSYFEKIPSLLVADEMHNLGSPECLKNLPVHCHYRLGLSATPQRHNDEEGTDALYEYFGEEVINFSLKDAIDNNCLTKYFYYPTIIEFTDEEWEEYKELTRKISKFVNIGSNGELKVSYASKILLLKRARLINSMKNKYEKFFDYVEKHGLNKHTLVYVGDTRDDDVRAVDYVVKRLGIDFDISCNKFTAETKLKERSSLLNNFDDGKTEAIVAIRCLDEGVDVPSTQHAHILASSTNPREYIQRRGRVLRKFKGKDFAYIHDYIALPPNFDMDSFSNEDLKIFKSLFRRELVRIEEFAGLAVNYGDTLELFSNIRGRLEL